ncbi:MAG: hypothetical protein COB66_01460 [Coxiella sp. (in: Bacteria)]|nr:MAG: hypothetical protein COB66_01460 [Coxiella sp. (in: g-proteobacteria)]
MCHLSAARTIQFTSILLGSRLCTLLDDPSSCLEGLCETQLAQELYKLVGAANRVQQGIVYFHIVRLWEEGALERVELAGSRRMIGEEEYYDETFVLTALGMGIARYDAQIATEQADSE